MVRGPICGETNPGYYRTPGPTGCNDAADPNNPILESVSPRPLDLAFKKDRKSKGKPATAQKPIQSTFGKVDAIAKLRKPSPSIIKQLSIDIDNVKTLNKQYETSKKQKDEALRLKKEKVIKDIVKAYGVGLNYVTGLEFSNRDNPDEYAITQVTFITTFDLILEHPGFVASIIIHESSHAQRNAELDKIGIKLSDAAETIWKALIEVEGAQLEIDSANQTEITEIEKRNAIRLRDANLDNIKSLMGEEIRAEIEKGGLDNVRARFVSRLSTKP